MILKNFTFVIYYFRSCSKKLEELDNDKLKLKDEKKKKKCKNKNKVSVKMPTEDILEPINRIPKISKKKGKLVYLLYFFFAAKNKE